MHLNGTSEEGLTEPIREAGIAIQAAITKLSSAAPHARDYYPQGNGAHELARSQHEARIALLDKARKQLLDILEAIENPELIEERDSQFEQPSAPAQS